MAVYPRSINVTYVAVVWYAILSLYRFCSICFLHHLLSYSFLAFPLDQHLLRSLVGTHQLYPQLLKILRSIVSNLD